MARSKVNQFDPDSIRLAELGKALAHPARVVILMTLAAHNRCICGEIVDNLPLAQSTVSQHLKELQRLGFIIGEIEGPRSCYCLNWDKLSESFEGLELFLQTLRQSGSCCE